MKKDIHPTFHSESKATCSNCSTVFTVGSTKESVTVEICRSCHPFWSGNDVVLDTAGRVDKFKRRAAQKRA